jgi:hypothetical protein
MDHPQTLLGDPAWTDNWTRGRGTLHGEILDVSAGLVWLAQAPMTREAFDELELPEGFLKTGIGESVADAAFFRRPPGAEGDCPLPTMTVGGVRFSLVARPGMPEVTFPGLIVLPVHKHHRLLYAAGTDLEILDCGDGADYVPLVRHAVMAGRRDAKPRPRILPEGWSIRRVALPADLVVELPCPTRVTFFASGDSFQGPLRLGL